MPISSVGVNCQAVSSSVSPHARRNQGLSLVEMPSRLIQAYAIVRFLFNQQKCAVSFDDGGDRSIRFPDAFHFAILAAVRMARMRAVPLESLTSQNCRRTPMSMADRDGFIWYDGKLIPWRDATTHVLTHSLHYGLSVFEGVRAYDTVAGTAIFRLKEHTDRLFNSAST